MALYVTGDCHGEWRKLRLFSVQQNLTEDDFIIVCGDFGIWDDSDGRERKALNKLAEIRPTVVFVSGNHENFDMLYQFPLIDKFGGKVREIAPDIYHLDRGQVLTIDGKKIFCMGGAVERSFFHLVEPVVTM